MPLSIEPLCEGCSYLLIEVDMEKERERVERENVSLSHKLLMRIKSIEGWVSERTGNACVALMFHNSVVIAFYATPLTALIASKFYLTMTDNADSAARRMWILHFYSVAPTNRPC